MTVKELIKFLKTQPKDMRVAYRLHSEQCLLEEDDISVCEFTIPREDGWIQNKRRDKETETFLLFPGN